MMSFKLTDLELRSYSLTIWIESDILQFGSYKMDMSKVKHDVHYNDRVRFHKPGINRYPPEQFVVRSIARIVDNERGPIRYADTKKPYVASSEFDTQVKVCLLNLLADPQLIQNKELLKSDYLTALQGRKESFFFTIKDSNICFEVCGSDFSTWLTFKDAKIKELQRVIDSGELNKSMHNKSTYKTIIDATLNSLKERPNESAVLLENELYRIAYYRVGSDITPAFVCI